MSDLVRWQPWGEQALAQARQANKPVLLWVHYDGCQWCEVMARECFADAQTSALINAQFVPIRVDRDERPDLDHLYQVAQQLLTRQGGGWPLTMFLDPQDALPFFGGTYFPARPQAGMPGFATVLERVAQYYQQQPQALQAQAEALREALRQTDALGEPLPPDARQLAAARQALQARFDRVNGGWGDAPKFPHVPRIQRLLRDWHATALGDAPDLQALYLATLALQRMAESPLRDADGSFFRYCVDAAWQQPQREKSVTDTASLVSVYADASRATGEALFRRVAAEGAAWLAAQPVAQADGKVALALLDAAAATGNTALQHHASLCLTTIRHTQWRDGRLWATATTAPRPALLDAHLDLINALLAAQAQQWDAAHLHWAVALMQQVLAHFSSDTAPGFFLTADDHEPLAHRSRVLADTSQPAGHSLAIQLLQRLGGLLQRADWQALAGQALAVTLGRAIGQPLAHASLFTALEQALHPPLFAVVRAAEPLLSDWRRALLALYQPRLTVLCLDTESADLPAPLAGCVAQGEAVGWLWAAGETPTPHAALPLLLDALRAAQTPVSN